MVLATIALRRNMEYDQMPFVEYIDPFMGEPAGALMYMYSQTYLQV